MKKTFIATILVALYSTPAHAVWDYSAAAQVAILDAGLAACGKIEPRLVPVLDKEMAALVHAYGNKAILAARKSREYEDAYRDVVYEQLKHGWSDPEEEAHVCESIYINLSHNTTEPRQWWRDRICADIALDADSEQSQHCSSAPRAGVSFENLIPDATISILRIVPSSDVSFPRAGIFPYSHSPGDRIPSPNGVPGVWAIPKSVKFEWKEWPRTFPAEPKDMRGLRSVRLYVQDVRRKVQRKQVELQVRERIPNEIIAEALQDDQTTEPGKPTEPSLKLFFIFTQDGLRLRWEQWHGGCIKNFGGDDFNLPRNRLLSGDWVCGESEPRS